MYVDNKVALTCALKKVFRKKKNLKWWSLDLFSPQTWCSENRKCGRATRGKRSSNAPSSISVRASIYLHANISRR